MVTITDGPGAGAVLMLQRAPRLLRVVVKRGEQPSLFDPVSQTIPHDPRRDLQARGDVDALDQPDDTPADDETVHVYARTSFGGRVHVQGHNRVRDSGWYVMAEYRHLADVDGEQLRSRGAWVSWAEANQHRCEHRAVTS